MKTQHKRKYWYRYDVVNLDNARERVFTSTSYKRSADKADELSFTSWEVGFRHRFVVERREVE